MEKPSLVRAIGKLAVFGEYAGFTVEEMIALLNAGVSVDTLLELIASGLDTREKSTIPTNAATPWIM